ncbi:YncE family protein [Streptomyces sp. NBC_00690]|uniref:YncE family protein n=1 Tax=Streptomyces sp. NBC_00690 TaxID=2975808 RepID=UPI002E2DD546|nr:YncE family protein [Streptomyces sp. NBC_00690]
MTALLAGAVALMPPAQAVGPQGVPVAAAKPRAAAQPTVVYVTNRADGEVAVVNAEANAVLATIPVGYLPEATAVSPDNTRVYVANFNSRSVSVIDTATRTVTATISVEGQPSTVTVSPDGGRVFVNNRLDRTLSVIDTYENREIATHSINIAAPDAAISRDGTRLYLLREDDIAVFNTTSETLEAPIPSPGGNYNITIAPDGTHAYISQFDNSVKILNLATGAFAGAVPMSGGDTSETVLTPDGTRAYTARGTGVAVVDTATRTVTSSVPLPWRATDLAISDNGRYVYATSTNNTLSLIDTTTNTTTARITPGKSPSDVVLVTPPVADLSLALTAQPVPGRGGIDYTLTATNNGPDRVNSAILDAQVPNRTVGRDCGVTGQTATCKLRAIAPGESVSRHFRIPASSLSLGTPYTFTATRTTSTPADPNTANDTATLTCTATTPHIINCA